MDLWLVVFGAGALLLRAGLALQASGSVRAKNSASAVMRVTANTAVIVLVFWAVGAAILLQGNNGWFGVSREYLLGTVPAEAAKLFFHVTIVLIGGAVVAGALAERSRFYVSTVLSGVVGGLLLPITGHWIWKGGWLYDLGFVDVGGASAIHLAAAVAAGVAVIALGPRTGKYNKDRSSNSIPGHALALSGVGVLLILAGWVPYLLGCVLTHAPGAVDPTTGLVLSQPVGLTAMNTLLGASAGALAGLLFSQFRYAGHPDIFFTFSGLVGGLVAISAGAGSMGNVGAVMTGAVAGLAVPLLTLTMDSRLRLDDPVGVIGIHGIGGLWGTLAAGLFVPLDAGGRLKQILLQVIGIVVIASAAAVVSLVVVILLRVAGSLRVADTDEFDGLDIGEHDINSYPDFQQTMIKSYHLREV